MLASLSLWIDPIDRTGPENMAVDEWLWQQMSTPLLRVYRWRGAWISIGYFSQAPDVLGDCEMVRRPTGGGIVDHRNDWTYTLLIPRGLKLAEMPGAQSYQVIHRALASVLAAEGHAARLTDSEDVGDAAYCFTHPVVHDLVDVAGQKIAGAGQRRGRTGLLHQGSVALSTLDHAARGIALAELLALAYMPIEKAPSESEIEELCRRKYRHPDWNYKR